MDIMKLERIAYNIYYMTNITISIYENNNRIYDTNLLSLPEKFLEEIEYGKQTIVENHKENKILRVQNKHGLVFLCLYINNKNVVVGPFIINDDYEKIIDEIILDFRLINEESVMIENFYNSLRVLSDYQQNMIVNIIEGLDTFSEENYKIYNVQLKKLAKPNEEFRNINEQSNKLIEKNAEIEEHLLSIVRNGDVELSENIDFQKISNQLLIYRNNSFTNMKTNLMIFDALCNREAIKAGVDNFLAHKISNNIKFLINKTTASSELRIVAQKILKTYAKAVKDYTLMSYSNNIKKIVLYIRKNLTNRISLDDIAKNLYITKEHLSRLFKKEMGVTISEYIIKTKIEQAKNMLQHTDYNILDIAVLLNFANSSHFSNSFKKITGVSPSDYRKNPQE
jgi:AraC-like DNA-binding protein